MDLTVFQAAYAVVGVTSLVLAIVQFAQLLQERRELRANRGVIKHPSKKEKR